MENKGEDNKQKIDWFIIIVNAFPILMIGTYFFGWITFFRICAILILLLYVWGLVEEFKTVSWHFGVYHILMLFIFIEIGYLLMDDIIDGLCMGVYVALIASVIEKVIRWIYKLVYKK